VVTGYIIPNDTVDFGYLASTTALLDPEFRSILGYAIDKQALLDKVHGGYGTVGSTQVPPVMENKEATPSFFWHTEPNNLRPFDIEMAKQKLTEAGYLLDATGQRLDKDQKPISLHLVMPDSDATYPQLAQFIQSWFAELGIKVKPDVVEENSLYDIMLPPEADPDNPDTYKADYDMFIWSWYETVEPNTLLQVFLCDQIGSSSDSLWCNKDYDALYEKQNRDRRCEPQAIIDDADVLRPVAVPILYYDRELDAHRTGKFAGWQNQPRDEGYPLFSYSVIDYQYLTDAKNPPASPSPGAPGVGGGAAPSAEVSASSPSAVRATPDRAHPIVEHPSWPRLSRLSRSWAGRAG
jgi:peptide/nickel transport system substrate-binding protein